MNAYCASFPNSTWLYSVARLREQKFSGISFRSTVEAMGGRLSSVRQKRKQMSWLWILRSNRYWGPNREQMTWNRLEVAITWVQLFLHVSQTSEIYTLKQCFAVKIPCWLWLYNYSFSFKIIQNQISREMRSFCWTARKYYLLMAPILWPVTIQENPPNTVLVWNVLLPLENHFMVCSGLRW